MGKNAVHVEIRSFKIPPSKAVEKAFTERVLAKVVAKLPASAKPVVKYKRIHANIYVGCRRPSRARDTFLSCSCDGLCGSNCKVRRLQCECLARGSEDCGNQRLQRRQYAKTEIRPAGIKGLGLFAMEAIMKGTLVTEYVGEVITREECMRRKAKTTGHLYFMALENDMFIDARHKANEARFINHSCDPNCIIELWYVGDEPRAAVVASKDISCDEELSFDYAFHHDPRNRPEYPCHCGSELCRGFIDAPRRVRP
ncbi:Histone methyltransferase HMT1 [Giardia muris]|uniref:Histone methyltransferase HMT1 n=1 Tax=Giardia muris TaxID=5742 RepID=A0A4Z1T7H3_GIAMU|nr:Histone methyltransferase HMT1 [Giardia muris]|eukprot:TNJ29097.1 Histone methyltransferase HMT1 [Giardia muris]